MAFSIRCYQIIALMLFISQSICSTNSESLFSDFDSVIQLDKDNYPNYVYGQNAFTLVNYYADWCGHCQQFAPIWKQLAHNVKNWNSIVRISAINCADPKNRDFCSIKNVLSFPSLRMFDINSRSYEFGESFIFNNTIEGLRHLLIDFLLKNQKSFSNKINILPISVTTMDELFNTLSIDMGKHNLIFLESHPNHLGFEIVMDFSSYTENVLITRIHDRTGSLTNELFPYYVRLPSLIQVQRNKKIELVASANYGDQEALRQEFGSKIRKLLHITDNHPVINIDNRTVLLGSNDLIVPKNMPPLNMIDLYNTLRFSLYDEVSRYEVLNSTQIDVIKQLISVTYKYFPFDNENVRRFFKRMNIWFANKSKDLKVEKMKSAMKISDGFLLPIVSWHHCNGSKPHFRRYPCGLWSLFHVMTVYEYKISKNISHEVLHAMRNFIINFYSCERCAKHFGQISRDLDNHLINRESSVLWLWRVHNQVNQRTKGQASEDPYYPKYQFPTHKMCPNCYKSNNQFIEDQVLQFLLQHYDKKSIAKSNSIAINLNITIFMFSIIIYLFNSH